MYAHRRPYVVLRSLAGMFANAGATMAAVLSQLAIRMLGKMSSREKSDWHAVYPGLLRTGVSTLSPAPRRHVGWALSASSECGVTERPQLEATGFSVRCCTRNDVQALLRIRVPRVFRIFRHGQKVGINSCVSASL